MSKYTTEVRFLCESLTGHDSSVGFNSAKDVIENACPLIFDFNFPIFDETYRLPLEIKILRHYYTREIGEETYGLWKLRLEDRLNVIMPYYNQLYTSALLSFNPFYDVDLKTTHAGSSNESTNNSSNEISDKNNNKTKNEDEYNNENYSNERNGYSEDENNRVTTGKNNGIENNVNSSNNSGETTTNGTANNKHTGTVENDVENNRVSSSNSDENWNDINNASNDSVEDSIGQSVNTSDGASVGKNSEHESNSDWNLYSDTPQAGIQGIENASSALPANGYLTNATHVIADNNSEGNNEENNSNVSTSNENNQNKITSNSNENNERKGSTSNVESGSDSTKELTTYNENNDDTNTTHTTNVDELVETSDNSYNNEHEENVKYNDKNTTNNSEVSVRGGSSNFNGVENEVEKHEINKIGNRISTNTDEYLQHVIGKSGGITYATMLLEYRETFINIDEMIIEELSDLFFGLW